MSPVIKKFLNWFFSALGTLFLIILVYFGWYKYLIGGLFIFGSIIMAYLGIHFAQNTQSIVRSNPLEPSLNTRKRVIITILLFLAAAFLFAWAILSLAGFIDYTSVDID